MKKIYMILGAALLCLTGCDKTLTTTPQHLKLDLTINNQMAPATKSVKTDWADGDKVYVFFGLPEEHPTPAYLTLTRSGSSWTEAWTEGLEAEIAATTSGTLTAFFSPIDINSMTYFTDWKWYNFSGNNYCFALACNNVPYTVSAGVLSATMDLALSSGEFVQFFLPGEADNVANLTFSSDNIMKSQGAGMIDETGKVCLGNQAYSYPIPGFAYDGGIIFSGSLKTGVSGNETAYTFTIVDSKGTADTADDVTYTLTKTATISYKDAILLPELSKWSVLPEVVDLGLTSGVKWAKFNLGATKPDECGNYYAWGETEPKSAYTWDTYFDTTDGGTTFTKYATDKKTVLDPEDDAAYAALGGKFRMPTIADWTDLINGCDWDWKTTDDGYAANGYLVTGPSGNTIFLPAAGNRAGTNLYGVGTYGDYWSSSLGVYYSKDARDIYFISNNVARSTNDRRLGFPIRPVSD